MSVNRCSKRGRSREWAWVSHFHLGKLSMSMTRQLWSLCFQNRTNYFLVFLGFYNFGHLFKFYFIAGWIWFQGHFTELLHHFWYDFDGNYDDEREHEWVLWKRSVNEHLWSSSACVWVYMRLRVIILHEYELYLDIQNQLKSLDELMWAEYEQKLIAHLCMDGETLLWQAIALHCENHSGSAL